MSEILVVNDSEQIRQFTVDHLRKKGLDTTGVFNGEEALKELQQGRVPTVIVSDLNQPTFEGYDLATFLRGRFDARILTATGALKRRFEPRLRIAEIYSGTIPREIFRARRDIRLILTSAGDQKSLIEAELKRHQGKKYEQWIIDTAELSYALEALKKGDAFVSLPPIMDSETNRMTGVENLDLLTETIRKQLEKAAKIKESQLE